MLRPAPVALACEMVVLGTIIRETIGAIAERRVARRAVEGEVDLRRDPAEPHPLHVLDEVGRQQAKLLVDKNLTVQEYFVKNVIF